MGPKNQLESQSNTLAKQISWIDRMYQKLEDICVEVDKKPALLIQETSKYVENQMFMVGTNVKKMYAELVQDLLPPPETTFDCPIHWKCDCKESENPTQGRSGCYATVEGAKCEGVEAEEVANVEAYKKVMDSGKAEAKMIRITTEQNETSEAEILTGANVEKHPVIVGNIKSKQKNFIEVVSGHVEKLVEVMTGSEEKNPEDIGVSTQEIDRDEIFVSQGRMPQEYREHNGMSKPNNSKTYQGYSKDVNSEHLSNEESTIWCGSKEESEINTKCGETFEKEMQAMEVKTNNESWLEDTRRETKVQQESKTSDCLDCNLKTYVENNVDDFDVKIRDVELPVSEMVLEADAWVSACKLVSSKMEGRGLEFPAIEMDSCAKPINSSESMKQFPVKLEEADAWVSTADHVSSNEHQKLSKGEDLMGMSGFICGADYEDEQPSAQWFIGASKRNILEHDSVCSKTVKTDLDPEEEAESEWVLV